MKSDLCSRSPEVVTTCLLVGSRNYESRTPGPLRHNVWRLGLYRSLYQPLRRRLYTQKPRGSCPAAQTSTKPRFQVVYFVNHPKGHEVTFTKAHYVQHLLGHERQRVTCACTLVLRTSFYSLYLYDITRDFAGTQRSEAEKGGPSKARTTTRRPICGEAPLY